MEDDSPFGFPFGYIILPDQHNAGCTSGCAFCVQRLLYFFI